VSAQTNEPIIIRDLRALRFEVLEQQDDGWVKLGGPIADLKIGDLLINEHDEVVMVTDLAFELVKIQPNVATKILRGGLTKTSFRARGVAREARGARVISHYCGDRAPIVWYDDRGDAVLVECSWCSHSRDPENREPCAGCGAPSDVPELDLPCDRCEIRPRAIGPGLLLCFGCGNAQLEHRA